MLRVLRGVVHVISEVLRFSRGVQLEISFSMNERTHEDTATSDSYLKPFVAMCNECEEDFIEVYSTSSVVYQIPSEETNFSQNFSEMVTGLDRQTKVSI